MSAQECYERSRALFNRSDLSGALSAVREAIAQEPSMSEAHNFEGWILATSGNLDAAIEAFRRARALAPGDPVPFTNLCDTLARANRGGEAVAIAESELRLRLFGADANNWLGWYALEAGDFARAITHLREATRERPGWGVAWLNLATALDRSGAERDAWSAYDAAVRCKDSHDPKRARGRRKELEEAMRARGEEAPKQPWRGIDGQPLGPEYEAIELMLRERRFDDAILAIETLAKKDWMARFYTIGLTERAAAAAHSAGLREQAKQLADLAVQGAVDWASGSTSGAEGLGRTYDLEQLRKRVARFR